MTLLCQSRAARIAACEVYATGPLTDMPAFSAALNAAAARYGVSRLDLSCALADVSTFCAGVALLAAASTFSMAGVALGAALDGVSP